MELLENLHDIIKCFHPDISEAGALVQKHEICIECLFENLVFLRLRLRLISKPYVSKQRVIYSGSLLLIICKGHTSFGTIKEEEKNCILEGKKILTLKAFSEQEHHQEERWD